MSKSLKLTEGNYFGNLLHTKQDEFVQYSLTSYSPHTCIEKHLHENSYISVLVRGCYAEVNNEGDTFLQSGNIIYRPAGCCHTNEFDKHGGTCFNIELKKNWQQLFDSDIPLPKKATLFKPGSMPAFSKLLAHFFNNSPIGLSAELLLHGLLAMGEVKTGNPSLSWINNVKQLLENETSEHQSVQSIARRVFVHPVYLSRAFKQKTGYTIGEYQLKMKLEKAFALLVNTNMPVNEIAFKTGFHDTPHLCRSFKLFYQSTPFHFRKLLKS